jgi:hypothetical protein
MCSLSLAIGTPGYYGGRIPTSWILKRGCVMEYVGRNSMPNTRASEWYGVTLSSMTTNCVSVPSSCRARGYKTEREPSNLAASIPNTLSPLKLTKLLSRIFKVRKMHPTLTVESFRNFQLLFLCLHEDFESTLKYTSLQRNVQIAISVLDVVRLNMSSDGVSIPMMFHTST